MKFKEYEQILIEREKAFANTIVEHIIYLKSLDIECAREALKWYHNTLYPNYKEGQELHPWMNIINTVKERI
tara:strand:+ start:12 stop:227 length:216 start_codon:yes stop_codon:yes gene_type:complete